MAGKGKGKKAKKKRLVVCGVIVCIVVCGVIFGVAMHKRSKMVVNAGKINVKSETVSTGNISNTVEGSGSIEVASTTDVTAPTGIKVKVVLVESGDTVTKGQTLATLDTNSIISALADIEESIGSVEDALEADGISSLQKKKLKGDMAELKESRKTLRSLRKKPVISASADGVIGSVNISDGSEISQSSTSSSSGVSSKSGSSQVMSNMTSSGNMTATAMNYSSTKTETSQKASGISADMLLCTTDLKSEESDSVNEIEKAVITDFNELSVAKPVTENKPQYVIKETKDYTGVISWNLATEKFQEQVAYTATITLTAKEGKVFSKEYTPSFADASSLSAKVSVVDGESVMTVVVKYPKTAKSKDASKATAKPKTVATKQPDSSYKKSTGSDSQSGNTNSVKQNGNSTGSQSGTNSKSVGNANNKQSINGNNASAKAGNGSSAKNQSDTTSSENSDSSVVSTKVSSTSSNSTSIYSDSESVVFTIQRQDSVKVSLSVDELDILSVKKGQTATVTLDAIEDKEFEGTITKVSTSASSSDGNAKYEVDITLEKDADMRIGMTASATINVNEVSDVLTIPMNALQQKGDMTFVYTKQEEDGNLSGEVTVETGLSDGQNVEVTSGLSEGDTIYYTRTGSDSSNMPNAGMGRGNMSGGNMPGGDFGGFQKGNGEFRGGHGEKQGN